MAVAAEAEVGHRVVVRAHVADHCRAHLKAVAVVEVALPALAVEVEQHGRLRGVARHRPILAEQVGDEGVVIAPTPRDVVEARIGVLLQPPQPAQVVLPLVVVAIAEQPHPEGQVVEHEAAEVRDEGLDADAHRVKVVAVRQVAQMDLGERLLHAELAVVAGHAPLRVDIDRTHLVGQCVVDVEGAGELELVVRRPEGGVAFEQRGAEDQRLRQRGLGAAAEHAIGPRALAGLGA